MLNERIKYGPGTLHRVVLNQAAGTSITLYDALSVVAGSTICILNPASQPCTVEYGLDFYTGLFWTTVGGGIDATVIYE